MISTKKAVALVLAVLMTISMMPLTVFADEVQSSDGGSKNAYQEHGYVFNAGGTTELKGGNSYKANDNLTTSSAPIEVSFSADNASVDWYDACQDLGKWSLEGVSDDYYMNIVCCSQDQAVGSYTWEQFDHNGTSMYDYNADKAIPLTDGSCTLTIDGNLLTLTGTFTAQDGTIYNVIITNGSLAPTTYTVTWQNYDGAELEVDNDVEEGATPTYNSAVPSKTVESNYRYDFCGWTDGENTYAPDELPAVTASVTYTAVYIKCFLIYVKTLAGTTYTCYAAPEYTIAYLKNELVEMSGIPFDKQMIIYAGKNLDNSKTFGEYNIQKESTLHLVKRTPNNGASLTLEDNIDTTIYIDAAYYNVDASTAVVKATYNHNASGTASDVKTDTISLSKLPQYAGETAKYVGTYMFTYACAPAQLTEECTVELYENAAAAEPVCSETYSAKEYCDSVNAAYNETYSPDEDLTKLNTLCNALVDYAKASQFQFNYGKDLTDAYRDDRVQSLTAEDIEATDNVKTADVMGFAFDCQDELNILVYTNSAVAPTGVSMNATKFADKITAAAQTMGGTQNVIRVKGLGSGNINKVITLETANGNITVSANAIAKTYVGASVPSTVKDLARAIYLYGAAAADYFGA